MLSQPIQNVDVSLIDQQVLWWACFPAHGEVTGFLCEEQLQRHPPALVRRLAIPLIPPT